MAVPKDPAKYAEYIKRVSEIHKNISEETRKKMSISQKNRPSVSEETRNKISMALKGKPSPLIGRTMPKETCNKISIANTGKKRSIESCQKMSAAQIGKTHGLGTHRSEEQRKKMSISAKNRPPMSEEQHKKISIAVKNRPPASEETRKKLSEKSKGRVSPNKEKIASEETRKKMSISQKNRPPVSEETKKKLSISAKNRPPMSEETRKKMSIAKKGKKQSQETIKKQRISHMGKKQSLESIEKTRQKNIGLKRSEETKQKLRDAWKSRKPMSKESRMKAAISNRGKKRTPEFCKWLSELNTGRTPTLETRKKLSMHNLGITNESEWNGFWVDEDYCGKWTDPKLKVRKRVRARYGDKCIICGRTREQNGGKRMGVHHVYRNKDACCKGEKSEWVFATLCSKCHSTEGHTETGKQKIREIIALEYGNKCILSLDEYNTLYPNGSELDKRWGYTNGK